MNVSEICAEGIFVTFPWWLENVKSRSKIALFSKERHFEIWFPKKRTITFFWSQLSKLHKKDPILHVATTFSLKQGETTTNHGPIPHPLISQKVQKNIIIFYLTIFYFFFPDNCESKLRDLQFLDNTRNKTEMTQEVVYFLSFYLCVEHVIQ